MFSIDAPTVGSNTVKVLQIKPFAREGAIKAIVTICVSGITIHGCKVVQQEGKQAWLAFPQTEFTARDGVKKYNPVVEMGDTLKREVTRIVLARWESEARHEF